MQRWGFKYLAMVLFLSASLLTACGGSGGGTATPTTPTTTAPATTTSTSTISGIVADGPITGATVTVTDSSSPPNSKTTTSGSDASYSVEVSTTWTFPVTITATGGTDIVTGEAPGFEIVSAVTEAPVKGAATVANINSFSTLMVKAAQQASGGLTTANLAKSKMDIIAKLGCGLDSTIDPLAGAITSDNIAEIIKANQALSEIIKRTKINTAQSSINTVIDALATDMTDGVMDGVADSGATLPSGVSAILQKVGFVANLVSLDVLTESMTNILQVTLNNGGRKSSADVTIALNSALTTVASSASKTITDVVVSPEMLNQIQDSIDKAIVIVGSDGTDTASLTNLKNVITATVVPSEAFTGTIATILGNLDLAMRTINNTNIKIINGSINLNTIVFTPPTAPTGVTASAGNTLNTISWSAVSGAASYNIYWAISTGVTASTVTKITGVTSPYSHTGLTNGTAYYYIVTAVNAGGESAASAEVSATPPAVTVRKVPDTGQTTKYSTAFGDDSDYTINPPSYTENGDGTVTDNVATLMWQKCSNGQTGADCSGGSAGTYNWYEAVGTADATYNPGGATNVCGSLTTGGYTDWRLPNSFELMLITDNEIYNPAINSTYFPVATASAPYWSATPRASRTSSAWEVYFFVHAPVRSKYKSYGSYVRCVRGTESSTQNFTHTGDGTVTDNVTTLMWQKQDDGTIRTWESAITYCEGLSLAGNTDWRLPNENELASIVDYTVDSPAINSTYFPATASVPYWSATTDANDTSYARDVDFTYGSVGFYYGEKSVSYYVRCVRAGAPLFATPTDLSITAGDRQNTISWSAVSGATSYNLYYGTTAGVTRYNGTRKTGVTSPYVHTGLTNATTYYYIITAVGSAGVESAVASSTVSAMPQVPGTTLGGQAVLGPLSGATIDISALDGTLIATGTAQSSTSMTGAGSFSFRIPTASSANIYLVTVRGGTDIDPTDSGTASTGVASKGAVHAYVTDAQANAGNIIVNPLTEIIYQDIALQYPNGVATLTSAEWTALLDAEAQKFLVNATSYSDVLAFVPATDKANSKISWGKVLAKLVKGIHDGDSSAAMMNRIQVLKSSMLPVATTLSSDGNSLERLEDVGGDRVKTDIAQNAAGQIDELEQRYVDASGAVVAVRATRISDTKSYLKATISKAGHTLGFEGSTSLLSGINFSTANMGQFVSKLVSIAAPDATSLYITLDKSLAARISTYELVFTVDGREPDATELSVLLDDPRLKWTFTATEANSLISSTGVSYTTANYPGTTLKILKDGTLFFEMPLSVYYKVSGILSDGEANIAAGKQLIMQDFIGSARDKVGLSLNAKNIANALKTIAPKIALSAAKTAMTALNWYAQIDKAKYLISDALPLIAEETFSSTRVELSGPKVNGNIILGEEYSPVIFIHSVNDFAARGNGVASMDVTLDAHYHFLTCPPLIAATFGNLGLSCIGHNTLSRNLGNYQFAKNKGYMIIPASKLSFSRGVNSGSLPSEVVLTADTTETLTHKLSKFGIAQQGDKHVDFSYVVQGTTVYLDASSSWILDGALADSGFATYSWLHNGIQLAGGKTASVPASSIDWGNGLGDITLEATSSLGVTGSTYKTIPLNAVAWNPVVTIPGAPSSVYAGSGNGYNSISWLSPIINLLGDNSPTGYNAYWSSSPGVTTASNKLSNVTSPYTHANLANGTTYYYVVTATNSAGESVVSSEVSAKPTAPVVVSPPVVVIPPIAMPATASVNVGGTVTITPTQGTASSYFSNNTGIATVTNAGVVTGVSAGTATITATDANGNTASTAVTVIAPQVAGLIDNGNGTITDNVTGLMWQKQDDNTQRSWQNAINYCNGLAFAGYADWRLPTIDELNSIVDSTKINPSIDTTFFPNTTYTDYWSATTTTGSPSNAWEVFFYDGSSWGIFDKSFGFYVRCVR